MQKPQSRGFAFWFKNKSNEINIYLVLCLSIGRQLISLDNAANSTHTPISRRKKVDNKCF